MNFRLGPDGVLRAPGLLKFDWLEHGFSTRRSINWPGDYTQVKQIHSDLVWNAATACDSPERGDGLITDRPGTFIGVRAADCVPILIADPVTRSVAAVHSGWRGSVQRIVVKAVRALVDSFGARPADLVAAIGPCIRGCCFEVGEEVGEQFRPWLPAAGSPRRVDLVTVNRMQLESAGVASSHIEDSGLCSYCYDRELLESFRRDREKSGRMVAAIRIRD